MTCIHDGNVAAVSGFLKVPEPGTEVFSFGSGIFEAEVIDRPNRFIVNVSHEGTPLKCHLHDPGRLKELIFPGNRVLCRKTSGRSTNYSITAARHDGEWILTDTRIHSRIASQFLPPEAQAEVRVGNHRLDFRYGNTLIEVKGCTLMVDGVATFPDAPTRRGREHLDLLRENVATGSGSLLIVLVFRGNASCFVPNGETDPQFRNAFVAALGSGVGYFIPRFHFDGNAITYRGSIGLCSGFAESEHITG